MRKKILCCLIVFSLFGFSQERVARNDSLNLVWGHYYFTNGAYKKAIQRWQKSQTMPPLVVNFLSKSYFKLGKEEKAQALMSQIIDSRHVGVEDYYYYANLLPNNSKLAQEYQAKAARLPLEKKVGYDTVQPLANIVLINSKRNTPYSEFGGYFVPEKERLDFYFLTPQKAAWTNKIKRRMISGSEVYNLHRAELNTSLDFENEAQLPTNINSIYQEGPIAIDTVQKIIFLSRSSGKIDKNNKLQVDLYQYYYNKPNQIPEPLQINMPGYSTLHPAVDYTHNRLIFASDRPGGQGGMDLYYIPLNQINENPEVTSLGTDVNSDNNETFPFVLPDGTLFYTNEASGRNKDFEINMALKGPANRWTTYLLSPPYNSNKDDFSFSLLLDRGLGTLSSNRPGGKGNDDLYLFEFQPQMSVLDDNYRFEHNDTLVIPFEGVLQNDLKLMVAKDPLILLVEKKALLKERPKNGSVHLNHNGSFLYKATSSKGIKDSFSYAVQSAFSTSKQAWVFLTPIEEPLSKDILKTFRPIYYDLDKNNLKESYLDRVEAVVRMMNQYPEMQIEIISSTDCLGSTAYNLKLSQRRTNTILNYVKTRISNPERLQGKGVGESNLPNNDTKNYTLYTGQFEQLTNAINQQKALEKKGVKSQIRTQESGLFGIAVQDFEYLAEARKARVVFSQLGIDTNIVACDCYQLPEEVHQLERKTIFNILRIGSKK